MPVIRLKTVVFPAPFGPMTLTISFSSTPKLRRWTTFRPPNAFAPSRSSSSATSDDLHARGSEDSRRPHVHDHDEQRAEKDEPCRARDLLHEVVLPDERGQVERRDQRDRAPPAV